MTGQERAVADQVCETVLSLASSLADVAESLAVLERADDVRVGDLAERVALVRAALAHVETSLRAGRCEAVARRSHLRVVRLSR